MATEDTMIDAPTTPAPIFAYRALKGIFFGSPEESPVFNPSSLSAEAVPMSSISSPKKLLSADHQIKLTPSHKRKRNSNAMLSPTKSCLRTPGAVTPRRTMLRDVTVTFKDPRKSMSPELFIKIPTTQIDFDANKENKMVSPAKDKNMNLATGTSVSLTESRFPISVEPSRPVSLKTRPTSIMAEQPSLNMQEQMARTEKEMKKLIRYSQKMKEYARKQDEENLKLKGLIEELQKENARLNMESKARNRITDALLKSKGIESVGLSERHDPSKGNRTTKQSTLQTRSKPASYKHGQTESSEVLHRETHQRNQNEDKSAHSSTSAKLSMPSVTYILGPKPEKVQENQKYKENEKPSPGQPPDPKMINLLSQKVHDPAQQHLPPCTNPISIHLPNDRLAAARARVRKKAELRKSSAESGSGDGVPHLDRKANVPTPGGSKVETSLLDWAEL